MAIQNDNQRMTYAPRAATETVRQALTFEAHDLVKTYPGDVRALDGLSFAVEAGTVFGLLGPNGAGKSTAVKILTTLSRPDTGADSGWPCRPKPTAIPGRSAGQVILASREASSG